jgi:membrane associated rhomboid family serine protease
MGAEPGAETIRLAVKASLAVTHLILACISGPATFIRKAGLACSATCNGLCEPGRRRTRVLKTSKEPLLNVPPAVTAILAALAVVHAVRAWVLSPRADIDLLLWFSFIPARYDAAVVAEGVIPGGLPADIWTFVSYAFIHADLTHLGINAVWLLAFGAPVARRFGTARFLVFLAVTAVAGAAAHLAMHAGELVPMVGASAAVSGCMAAAMRFVFQSGGPLGLWPRTDMSAYRLPAEPLATALRDPRVLAFLAVWFGLNLLFGLGSLSITGGEHSVAWEAHIGGFVAGLILFPVFDPVGKAAPLDGGRGDAEARR